MSTLIYHQVEEVTKSCDQCSEQEQDLNHSIVPLPDQLIMTLLLPAEISLNPPYRDEFMSVLLAKAFATSTTQFHDACPNRICGHESRASGPRFAQLPEYLMFHVSRNMTGQEKSNIHIIGTVALNVAALCSGFGGDMRRLSYYELHSEIRYNCNKGASSDTSHYFTYSRLRASKWLKFEGNNVSPTDPFADAVSSSSPIC